MLNIARHSSTTQHANERVRKGAWGEFSHCNTLTSINPSPPDVFPALAVLILELLEQSRVLVTIQILLEEGAHVVLILLHG